MSTWSRGALTRNLFIWLCPTSPFRLHVSSATTCLNILFVFIFVVDDNVFWWIFGLYNTNINTYLHRYSKDCPITGFPDGLLQLAAQRRLWQEEAFKAVKPQLPTPPPFIPKCDNLPRLDCYSDILPDSYWDKWRKKEFRAEPYSWICAYTLFMLALNSGFPQMVDICILASRLCEGVEIGAEKAARYLLKSILFDCFLTEQPHTCLHNKYCSWFIFL